ncbi:MAG: hypothetical protein OHK93_004467, partial [Ramalina farinacea]|nr:hypothetical protein [Ramalina farinacea]
MQKYRFNLNQDPSTDFLSEEVEVAQCGSQRVRLNLKAGAGIAEIAVMVFDEQDGELLLWIHCWYRDCVDGEEESV